LTRELQDLREVDPDPSHIIGGAGDAGLVE